MGLFDFFRRKKKNKDTEPVALEERSVKLEPKKAEAKEKEQKATQVVEETAQNEEFIDITEEEVAEESSEGATPVDNTCETVSESKPGRVGRFEIKRAKDGRFHFNLYASNNFMVARSQIYSSSSAAMNGIKSVITNAPKAQIEDQTLKNVTTVSFPKWEIYNDNAGQFRFRLRASNGSCICHSRGYTAKSSCKRGIESIIRFANDAKINKVYLDN